MQISKGGCNKNQHIRQKWVSLVKRGEVNFFSPNHTSIHAANNNTNTIIFYFFENSNSHQISQTKISFWLTFHVDHESKLKFHSKGLYREKSEKQVLTPKNKTQKNSELSKIN